MKPRFQDVGMSCYEPGSVTSFPSIKSGVFSQKFNSMKSSITNDKIDQYLPISYFYDVIGIEEIMENVRARIRRARHLDFKMHSIYLG